MAVGLFICLFVAFFLLCVPLGEYEVSPANAAVDVVKRRLGARLTSGEKGDMLKILEKNTKDVVRTGLLAGVCLALIAFLVSYRFIGPLSVILCPACLMLGIFLTEKVLQNEYRQWQTKLFEGVPTLISFVPAFLEVEGVTPREALSHTVPFLPEPLKSEMRAAINKIKRTGRVREAMDVLARKAKHPLVDAVCFRLSAAWDAKITPDIFADLYDQVEDIKELTAARATVAKTGYLALVCVLGLIGMILTFVYPGVMYLMNQVAGGFGGS